MSPYAWSHPQQAVGLFNTLNQVQYVVVESGREFKQRVVALYIFFLECGEWVKANS